MASAESSKFDPSVFNAEPQAYLLAGGHGAESLEPRKYVMPPGTTLITFTTCGTPTVIKDTFANLRKLFVADKAASEADIESQKTKLLNPRDTLFEIADALKIPPKTMRITLPGQPCPNLYYTPLLITSHPDVSYAEKSGVYRYPLKYDQFYFDISSKNGTVKQFSQYYKKSSPTVETFSGFSSASGTFYPPRGFVQKLFVGSVFPTPEFAKKVYDADPSVDTFMDATETHIYDIMTHLGPGVYYYFACRSPKEHFPFRDIFRNTRTAENMNILALAEKHKEKGAFTEENVEALGKIEEIRNASQEQQNIFWEEKAAAAGAGAKARRTRRLRRKSRKSRRNYN